MRDKEYCCIYCGKYIAYKDIPDKVEQFYTPDSDYSHETWQMWHKKCKPIQELEENNRGE